MVMLFQTSKIKFLFWLSPYYVTGSVPKEQDSGSTFYDLTMIWGRGEGTQIINYDDAVTLLI